MPKGGYGGAVVPAQSRRLSCVLSIQVLPCAEQPGGLTVSLRAPRDVAERVAAAVLRRRAARAEARMAPAPRHDECPSAERVVGVVTPPKPHSQPGGGVQPTSGGGQVASEADICLTVPIGHTRFSWLGEAAWLGHGARGAPPEREACDAPPPPLQPPSPSRQPSWPPPLGHTTFSWAAARDAQGALCVPAEPSRCALVWLAGLGDEGGKGGEGGFWDCAWSGLHSSIPRLQLLLRIAPRRRVSALGGVEHAAWFDVAAWPLAADEPEHWPSARSSRDDSSEERPQPAVATAPSVEQAAAVQGEASATPCAEERAPAAMAAAAAATGSAAAAEPSTLSATVARLHALLDSLVAG